MELDASEIDRFRRALAAHADAAAPGEGYSEPLGVDAFVGAEALSLDLAEQIAELGPFGLGNPSVELLVPGAKVENVQPMGEGGRHARFSIRSGRGGARGVAFGANGRLAAAQRSPHDLAVRLEINRWNGVAEPRAVLSDAYERAPHGTGGGGGGSGSSSVSHLCPGVEADAWWGRFQEELERGARAIAPAPLSASQLISAWRQRGRTTFDRRGRSALAQVSELASTRERVLVLTSDAARRAALIGVGHGGRCVCLRCSATALEAAVEDGSCRLLVSDWTSVSRSPELTAEFEHLVVLDPPVLEAPAEVVYGARGSGGFLHALLAPPEELALRCWEAEWGLRPALAEIYRSVGGSGCAELAGEGLRAALSGSGPFPRTPEISARCVRILVELGIAELLDGGDARLLRVVSSEKTDLERSGAWRAVQATHEAGLRFLEGLTTEHSRSPSALAS